MNSNVRATNDNHEESLRLLWESYGVFLLFYNCLWLGFSHFFYLLLKLLLVYLVVRAYSSVAEISLMA